MNRSKKRGFALVVTLALMILLTVIAVGLLSLSAISLRSSSQTMARSEAQANARLALMLAIGELQKQMGPDQRISANGAMLDTLNANGAVQEPAKNPHWTGVWNSWKAGDGTSFHRSVEGESLLGMAPSYQPGRNDFFRSWLVSLLDPVKAANWESARDLTLAGEAMPDKGTEAVQLVGQGSLGTASVATDYVSAELIDIQPKTASSLTGRYGWWVGDESQKARVMGDSYNTRPATTTAEKIARAQAPGSTGTTTVTGLKNISNDGQLVGLPSLQSLDLVDVNPARANGDPKPADNFHHVTAFSEGVIADVREGGLKRDLSALLERKIDPAEVDAKPNEFSLYKFNTKDQWASAVGSTSLQECVPIQDLAAFYQLYDAVSPEARAQDPLRVDNKRGVRYATSPLGGINGMHLLSTDFGTTPNSPVYLREYSSIYRQPRIVKIQFLLSLFSKPITPALVGDRNNLPNTHELIIGLTPAITFWNPTNLPVVFQMNSDPKLGAQMMRFNDLPLRLKINKTSQGTTITTAEESIANLGGINDGNIFNLYWAGIHPIRLEPGEIKTCSLPFSGDLSALKSSQGHSGHWNQGWAMSSFFMKTDTWYVGHEVKVGWEPQSFIYCNNSAKEGANNGSAPTATSPADTRHVANGRLRFKSSDRIQIEIGSGGNNGIGWMNNSSYYQDFINTDPEGDWDRYNSLVGMRNGGGVAFFQPLIQKGMTGGAASLLTASRSGSSIIARSSSEEGWPFMHFGVMAGVETNEASNGGFAGGRKFANRPFLHSSTLHSHPFLDNNTGNDLYNFGWNWTVDLLNDVYEAPVQVEPSGSSFWGGGYTEESGTTHVIQQEIPIVPPISIAALSHARLGGWSISDQTEMPYTEMGQATATRKRNITRAVGFGGLRPHTLQAIGNSYAHPQIPADKAYITVSRTYNTAEGSFNESFADHSYLANKALWDEFFFSSITPQAKEVKVFENSSTRTAKQVAEDFFRIDDPSLPVPLPNRRMVAYTTGLDQAKLDNLFTQSTTFTNGLADKIAAHLMVKGAFNINSTSVEAWKVLFSSLKGKPVAYVSGTAAMNGNDPTLATSHTGTPIGQVGLPGGQPYSGSPSDPRNPEQWTSWRELTDTEIDELAKAIVHQVKLRGPFLSLSEFVNRRLDATNPKLAVKGALQSALDYEFDPAYPKVPEVSINKAFRADNRKFSAAELSSMSPVFKEAAEGPIAYGSSAYIDQADVLRGFAEQLTPRGDTFVIRTYGDSLDPQGKVRARAWCEAVVQRVPDYVDGSDDPSEKPSDDTAAFSTANKTFGRKLQLISFRWLNPSEV